MNTLTWRAGIFGSIGTGVAALAIACSDDTNGTVVATHDGGAPDVVTKEASADAAREIGITNVVSFDATQFELPEALSFRDGFAYVSLAPKAKIERVALATGERALYATLPLQASNFVLGSTFDAEGNLFVGVGATNPGDAAGVAAAGVYRIPAGGAGASALFASSDAGLKFGNGLAFDAQGNLFVTDAAEGAVYEIPPAGAVGTAAVWKQDVALTGDMTACPVAVAAFPIGANGIFVEEGAVWVGNTDRGSLVKIAIEASGVAGAVTTIASDCALLEGLDGLRPDPRDPTAAFVGTNNPKNMLVRVTRGGAITVLHEGSPPNLDGPADLVHVTGSSNPAELLVVNSSFPEAFAPPDAGLVPRPSLVKVTLP